MSPVASHEYPNRAQDRDAWILSRRSTSVPLDAHRPVAVLTEQERAESGDLAGVLTVFLANRECPWRCVMCDLWKHTLADSVPTGAIPAQLDWALTQAAETLAPDGGGELRQIKLYNSGSFFDPQAIPPEDFPAIASRSGKFERVIVECHPALIGESCLNFRDLLIARGGSPWGRTSLEVAIGLETVHPEILPKLNKRMTLDLFRRASDFLRSHGIAMRAFILVKPPFLMDESEAVEWAERSIDFAFECGASAVSLIPTRGGNGAMEALESMGQFAPPKLASLEAALDYGVGQQRGRVFADLWDLEKFSNCGTCLEPRRERLRQINWHQAVLPPVICKDCQAGAPLAG